MQKITPCLWFEGNAEEAVEFYTSIFPVSKVGSITRYTESGPGIPGSVLTIEFGLNGNEFMALNGGPYESFSHAVSFVINCEDQEEVDRYWERLSEGGEIEQCGWLKDKFGVSWQVVPVALTRMFNDHDTAKVERMTRAMLQMNKLDISTLERAFKGDL